ncbi:MAG: hypothetical protein A2X49_07685 [Lentisphaerae bacterium GWF2_52_8]|nr:MAG: hypothetical protein A2X49_07685 [Lentisphaerae bacterium GWF2_52_8]
MITQKDIARKLGISPSLVSRALCGTARDIGASEETVRRIREEAQRLNYAPNAAALTLRGAKSMTIGIVIKDFEDPFFGGMIGRLQELARENGFSLLLTGCPGVEGWDADMASLLRYQLDALIICGSDVCAPWIRAFSKKGLPIVQIGEGKNYPGVSRVEMDEEHGMALLLDLLQSLGHQHIGFIGGGTTPHKIRMHSLKRLMVKSGLPINSKIFVSLSAGRDTGELAMGTLLDRAGKKLPSAVIAADDSMAQGALRRLHEAGLSVPLDISLTGIDDIPSARLMVPSLTSLKSPIDKMVRAAFKLVVESPGGKACVLRFKPELIKRESCARFGGGKSK